MMMTWELGHPTQEKGRGDCLGNQKLNSSRFKALPVDFRPVHSEETDTLRTIITMRPYNPTYFLAENKIP